MFTLTKEFERTLISIIGKTIDERLAQIIAKAEEKNPPKQKEFLSKKAACDELGISLSKLNKDLAEGKLKRYYIGSNVRLKASDVKALIKNTA